MTVTEFESYLHKGLGRAILLLREEKDKTPFLEAVWNHALHDPRFDRQCNASRGHYIKALFDCFPDGDALLSEYFRLCTKARTEPDDRRYFIHNLTELNDAGTEGTAAAQDRLCRLLFEELLTLPNPLTNGIDYERDDYHQLAEDRYHRDHAILGDLVRDSITLVQRSSRYRITDFIHFFDQELAVSQTEEFAALLASLEKEDPAAREVCESYRKEKEELQARRNAARKAAKNDPLSKPTTWRESIEFIRKGNPILPTQKTLWQNLPENDRAEIARLAEEERDPLRRTALFSQLRRFGGEILQSYPRDPSPLIEEMERNASVTLPVTPENRWLWELCGMTAKIRHPTVREAALRMLPRYRDDPASIPYLMAPEACFTNYQPGDEAVLTDFITSVRDEEELHRIGMALIYECEVPLPEAVWLYLFENTTCSSCRTRFFTALMEPYGEYRNLPAHLALIREEAKLDCDCGTRIIAQGEGIEKKKRL